jgi:hypothetical protein
MPISEPGKMDTPFVVYHHSASIDGIDAVVDHENRSASVVFRRHGKQNVELKQLSGSAAAEFAHLSLHHYDLASAREFLVELEQLTANGADPPMVACRAMWTAALISTIKCFDRTSRSRSGLNPNAVFGESNPLRADFDHLKSLRDKHVAHDDNDWLRAIPLALIEQPEGSPSIASIHALVMRGEVVNADNISRLRSVTGTALQWVAAEWTVQAERLRSWLATLTPAELAALPDVAGQMPNDASVQVTRGKSI